MEVLPKEREKKEVKRYVKRPSGPVGIVDHCMAAFDTFGAVFYGRTVVRHWSEKYTISFVGLVLFWALENFLVQASLFDAPPNTTHPLSYETIRFGLNLLAAVTVTLLLPRFWLVSCMAADSAVSLIVIAYTRYFHHDLSLYYEAANFKEGLKVTSTAAHIIPLIAWILLFCALVLKVLWARRITPQPRKFRFQGAGLCASSAILIILALQYSGFRFSFLRVVGGSRAIFAYGTLTTWAAECFYSPDMKAVKRELCELQALSPDRLGASEPAWPVAGNVVVIQMESVGWDILDYQIQGQPVTPYLNSLARSSRTFKVRSYHDLGSADMDYAVLSDGTPSSRMVSYTIPGVTYTNALPRFMQEHGFRATSFHGNDSGYYNRLPNYQQMGFDEILFKKEIAGQVRARGSSWGVRDRDVLQLSSKKLRAAREPQFHFIITLDSHTPFNLIDDSEKEVYPHSQVWEENYFNSVQVVDRDLRNYVESLAPGTMVLLYGDHTPGVVYGDFHSAREGNVEYVPCIVHLCKPATPWPEQPGPVAGMPEDLRIHDIMNHLRRQVSAAPAKGA